jgi:hypothetical protein
VCDNARNDEQGLLDGLAAAAFCCTSLPSQHPSLKASSNFPQSQLTTERSEPTIQ